MIFKHKIQKCYSTISRLLIIIGVCSLFLNNGLPQLSFKDGNFSFNTNVQSARAEYLTPTVKNVGTEASGGTDITTNLPTYADGDLMLLFVFWDRGDYTIPTIPGWTLERHSESSNNQFYTGLTVYSLVATSSVSAPVVSISVGGGTVRTIIVSFNNAAGVDIDAGNSSTATALTSFDAPSVTTTRYNTLILNAVVHRNAPAMTAPNTTQYSSSAGSPRAILSSFKQSIPGSTGTQAVTASAMYRPTAITVALYGKEPTAGTFSGTLYSDNGVTPVTGSSYTVKAVVGTSTPSVYSTTTNSSNGTFSFSIPTSTAPTTWNLASSSEQNNWQAVAFGNGRFVAVSNTGTNVVMYSTNGTSWTAVNPGISINPNDIIFANGRFDVIGSGTTKQMYSYDGINWTAGGLTTNRNFLAYGEDDGIYVAIDTGGVFSYSYDGNTWTTGSDISSITVESLTYGEGKFRAGASAGTNSSGRMYGSADGVTWSTIDPGNAYGHNDVAYGNGVFVAVTTSPSPAAKIRRSDTGNTSSWSGVTPPGGGGLYYDKLDFVNGYFVAISYSATTSTQSMAISSDGTTWQEVVKPEANTWKNVAYGNGRAVSVSSNGTSRVMYADMGIGPQTPITVWVDGSSSMKATSYLMGADNTRGISDIPLYQNTLTIRNATYDADKSVTELNRSTFYDSSDDSDILYTSNIGTGSTTASSSINFYTATGTALIDQTIELSGNFTNAHSIRSGQGTLIFKGTSQQTVSGTLTGADDLYNIILKNTSQDGATSQSLVFGSKVNASGTFEMLASTSVALAASATSTFKAVDWQGTSGSPVWIYSSSPGTRANLVATGTINYVNVKDSNACGSPGGGLTTANGVSYGNNTCWTGLGSASGITLSGTLYSDEGTTAITSGKTIKLAVGTSTVSVHSTTTDSGAGTFHFNIDNSSLIATGTPITIWVDGDGSTRASLVSELASVYNNVSGLDLYKNAVIVRAEGSSSTALAEMSIYDSTDDSDIQFTASTTFNSLNILNGQELHIWSGDTFTAPASTTLSGNFHNDSGVFVHNSGVMHLTGTTKTINGNTIGASNLGALEISGSYTFSNSASTTDVTISSGGTLTAPAGNLSIEGNYTNSGTFTHSSGVVTFDGSTQQTATGTLTGSSAFYDLTLNNTSQNGTTSQSIIFSAAASSTNNFKILASSSVQFKSGSVYTFQNVDWNGLINSPIWLKSSIDSSAWYLDVNGTQTNVNYVNVKDSNATLTSGGINPDINSIDISGNTNWNFFVNEIILSGTLYSDEGSTPITSGKTIKLAIGTSTVSVHATTTDSGAGTFHFNVSGNHLTATNTPIVLWVDGDSVKATLSSKLASTTAPVSGLNLWQSHVIISNEGTGSISSTTLTTADMAFYDTDNDSDIQFSASSTAATALTVKAGNELYVNSNKNFSPIGAVVVNGNAGSGTDGSLEVAAGAGYYGSKGSLSLAGNLVISATSAFIPHTSGTIFTATTTGKTITATLPSSVYQNIGDVDFNGSSGGWTITDHATTSNFTITAGTVTVASAKNLTVIKDFNNSGTFSNSGSLVIGPSDGWNFETASYSGVSADVSADESSIKSIFFKPDGTKMYIVGIGGDEVNEYTLSTPWSISSRGSATAKSIVSETTDGWKIRFTPDGRMLYVTEDNTSTVYRYTLSTPWSISSASHTLPNLSFSPETGAIEDIEFNSDGTKAYMLSEASQSIYTYNLSRPWDLSSKTYTGVVYSVIAQESSSEAIEFNNDGTQFFLIGNSGDDVNTYHLSTPWTISSSSVTFAGAKLSVAAESGASRDMYIKPDGTKMYMADNVTHIYSYNLRQSTQKLGGNLVGSSALGNLELRGENLKSISANASTTNLTLTTGTTSIAHSLSVAGNFTNNASVVANGSKLYLTGSGKTVAGSLVKVNSLNNVTVSGSYTFSNNASTTNLTINSGGSLIAPSQLTVAGNYVNNGTFNSNSGTLTVGPGVGYDFTTVYQYGSAVDVSGDSSGTRGIFFKPDGTKMYTISNCSNGSCGEVNQYTLSTPWDVSTKGSAVSYNSGTNANWNIIFTPDGKVVYMSATGSSQPIRKYTLSTPWDISTISYTGSGHTLSQDSGTHSSINFSEDGTKLYVIQFPSVYTYSLSTPWDISNTSVESGYLNQYNLSGEVTDPNGISFKPDGTKMYVASRGSDDVYVYGLSTPWEVSTSSRTLEGVQYSLPNTDTREDFLSTDGTKYYIVDNSNSIYTYHLSETQQTLSGAMTGSNSFANLIANNSSSTIFAANASTTNLTLKGTTTAPSALTINGNYTNNSIFKANNGKVYLSGSTQQTATGTLSGTSAFHDLTIGNTSQNGTTSQSVVFGAVASTTGTFMMLASTSAQFLANATNTFQNININGGSDVSEAWLRSSNNGSQWHMSVPGTASVYYANLKDSNVCGSTGGGLTATSSTDVGNNTCWTFASPTVGSSTISDHTSGQVSNAFNFQDKTNQTLFAFRLNPNSNPATTTDIVFTLSGAKKIVTTDFINIRLYRDVNNDTDYDGGDTLVANNGVMSITGRDGTVTFTDDFAFSTAANYILVADWNAPANGSFLKINLYPSDLTVIDGNGIQTIFGSVSEVQHNRNNKGGGGNSSEVGGGPPAGAGQQGGGGHGGGGAVDTNSGGQTIGNDPSFAWPTAQSGSWTNGANAIDKSDGTYATDNSGVTNNFTNHNFTIPGSNQITGVELKLEVSGTTAAGTIGAQLSWDGGTSWTSSKTTATLTTTDAVVSLGGPSDLWGRTWSVGDFSNANFIVRLTGAPSSNTVKVDAIQVRVYNQASGGGGGGGGEI